MKVKEKRALTLIELIVVIVIVGILASIALPRYTRAREKAIDKQAQAILPLIRSAERIYKMEMGNYTPMSGSLATVSAINSNLSLDLVDDGNWVYSITPGFYATLTRNVGGYNRYWWINSTTINATCSGCP